jgi:AraC-like DNA-binding protein
MGSDLRDLLFENGEGADQPRGPQAFDWWREAADERMMPSTISTAHRDSFRAALTQAVYGEAVVSALSFTAMDAVRGRRHIRRADPEMCSVALVVEGHTWLTQGRNDAEVGTGGLVLYDTSHPYHVRTGPGAPADYTTTLIVLSVPAAALPPFGGPAGAGGLLATSAPPDLPAARLLTGFLTEVARAPGVWTPNDALRLGATAVDLFALLVAALGRTDPAGEAESRQRILPLRVRAFIEDRLGDPRLTPAGVAAAHHLSLRQLQRVFAAEEEGVAGYIRRRRLENCRDDLAAPALADSPIQELAARWCFGSGAQFARAFRAAYRISPREFRKAALGGSVDAVRHLIQP